MGVLKSTEGQATVAILGGNPVIGKALESLLRSADYATRYFSEYPEDDAESLAGAKVALILPALSSRHQEALITRVRSTPSTTNLHVIELCTSPNEISNGHVTRVPWPCGVGDLRRFIDEKLSGDPQDSDTPNRQAPGNPQDHDDLARQHP